MSYEKLAYQDQPWIDVMPLASQAEHWHQSLEIIYVQEGILQLVLKDKKYQITSEEFLAVNASESHELNCHARGIIAHISYDFLLATDPHIEHYRLHHGIARPKGFDDLLSLDKNEEFYPFHLLALCSEMIYDLYEHYGYPFISDDHQKEKLAKIMCYLKEHSDEHISREMLAEKFQLSYGYIAKLFKKYLGMSVSGFVMKTRMSLAEKDLLTTDKSIMDICMDRGFANTKSFYREFHKAHQCSPKEFRLQKQS